MSTGHFCISCGKEIADYQVIVCEDCTSTLKPDKCAICGDLMPQGGFFRANKWICNACDLKQMYPHSKPHDYNNSDIVGIRLFNGPTGCVCVVALWDDIGKYWVAYIGVGKGENEKSDALKVAQGGVKLEASLAVALFPGIGFSLEEYKKY